MDGTNFRRRSRLRPRDIAGNAKSLHGFMNRVDRHVRAFNNLGHDTVGDVERAGLLPTWIDAFYLERGADQSSIAQDDFSYALPNGCDLGRSSPEFEGEGLSVAECHIFAPFPLRLSNLFPGCQGTKTAKQRLLARLVPFAGTPVGRALMAFGFSRTLCAVLRA